VWLSWFVWRIVELVAEGKGEEIEAVWDWCADGHLVDVTCVGGHHYLQGHSPIRQLR
jgi:hypothetical protein